MKQSIFVTEVAEGDGNKQKLLSKCIVATETCDEHWLSYHASDQFWSLPAVPTCSFDAR